MIKLGRKNRLSQRILVMTFAAILLTVLALLTLFSIYSRQAALDSYKDDLDVLVNVIGDRSKGALVFIDKRLAKQNVTAARFNKSVDMVCLYDANRTLFASYEPVSGIRCDLSFATPPEDDSQSNTVVIHENIKDSGDVIGSLLLQASTSQLNTVLFKSSIAWLPWAAMITVCALLFIRVRIKKGFMPLSSLYKTAEEISINPFALTRAVAKNDDEIGRVVEVFNGMLDSLASENAALKKSQNRFKSLSQDSPIGIFHLDADLNYIFTNDKWREITGLSNPRELSIFEKFITGVTSDFHSVNIEKARSNNESLLLEYQFEARGSKRVLLEHVAPIFEGEARDKFSGFIGSLIDITDLKNAQVELEQLAFYDPLTGLPNRRFFLDYLNMSAQDKSGSHKFALMMLDIDNFKKINDTLGHEIGDNTLKVVGDRLKSFLGGKDMVCRLGGDEFMVFVCDIESEYQIKNVADRILEAIRRPVSISGYDFDLTCSLGIVTSPQDGNNSSDLMRKADLALYLSKDKGKNKISFFSKVLERQVQEKVDLESKLKKALLEGNLSYHIQPKLNLSKNKITSGEVLIRWEDPVDGYVSPAKFIPVAEETNLILSIGDWLLDSFIRELGVYKDSLDEIGLKSFAINLSAKQFYDVSLVDKIKLALEKYQVPAQMIEFELTESSVIEDIDLAVRIMEQLKALGCKLSIDDFGTGYSSLSYLKRFPIDYVKIDRSFIMDIPQDSNDVEISIAIISMGHSLDLEIIAEGVETSEQLAFLKQEKCEYVQGFYIAKPMPFDKMLTKVRDYNQL